MDNSSLTDIHNTAGTNRLFRSIYPPYCTPLFLSRRHPRGKMTVLFPGSGSVPPDPASASSVFHHFLIGSKCGDIADM